jgi:uncharacterized protein (DUF1778 family)
MKESRSERVTIRFSPTERDRLEKVAQEHGQDLAEFIREAAVDRVYVLSTSEAQ